MSLLGSGLQKTWESGVASQCVANGVKMCLDDNLEFGTFTTMLELDEVNTDC